MSAAQTAGQEQLEDLLRCFICFDSVVHATLCPSCSKLCCRACILQWLDKKSSCPHCRVNLTAAQLVNARFFNDIKSVINKFSTTTVTSVGHTGSPSNTLSVSPTG